MKDENKAYAEFLKALVSFSLDLLKKTEAGAGENTLVSPLSVCLALAMAANGADGETLAQMEKVLGLNLDLDSLNLSLSTFVKNLKQGEKAKFQFANSLWLKKGEGLTVDEDFLKRNDEFYRAEVFLENFDNETLEKINEWVKRNTQGLIDKILDEIQDDSLMYLINALAFDASWRKVYDLKDIYDRDFKSL
ncbi:MAG TPA: serpin family protein, partial [Oscillospiraceae bacterium]|nr:serpin family protein [Oscillospiraceae bacterium]